LERVDNGSNGLLGGYDFGVDDFKAGIFGIASVERGGEGNASKEDEREGECSNVEKHDGLGDWCVTQLRKVRWSE
jgi:hypothetical protein